jgi:hypothetical protein
MKEDLLWLSGGALFGVAIFAFAFMGTWFRRIRPRRLRSRPL